MPSIASVDLGELGEEVSFSESSDLQKARKLYAELQAMSMESTGSFEVSPGSILSIAVHRNVRDILTDSTLIIVIMYLGIHFRPFLA